MVDISKPYKRDELVGFLRKFLPEDFKPSDKQIFVEFKSIKEAFHLGTCGKLDLDVFECCTKSNRDPRVTLTKEVVSLMKKFNFKHNALVVFHSNESNSWRFSLITTDYSCENEKIKIEYSNPRRFSFKLGTDCKKHTPETMLFSKTSIGSIDELKKCFDIEVVTKEFYQELFNWYSWACKVATYPEGSGSMVKQTQKHNECSLIRLITRLIFVWFIKQKNLVPQWIFDEKRLTEILSDFDSQSLSEGNYYNAILQNLFFATLNKPIEERSFAFTDTDKNRQIHYGIKTLYRDNISKSFFRCGHDDVVQLFRPVPFLNGGLFECLDKLNASDKKMDKQIYVDGFSREEKRRAFLPNALFFNRDKGIIAILNRYNFTVEENSPVEVQVALDPELLGRVFENLLGEYNPETKETARKKSGSFYTPREVVNYMVDESLIAYLGDTQLVRSLFRNDFDADSLSSSDGQQLAEIAEKLQNVKIFDPACGSGAFPMGLLSRIVDILQKTGSQDTPYNLKLRIIENCIYGCDIQSIAAQISKLRFFISIICDCEKDESKENHGISCLPNLETKFVTANSLIELKRKTAQGQLGLFEDNNNSPINKKKAELLDVRHQHFSAKSATEKRKLRKQDEELRRELKVLLTKDEIFDHDDANKMADWNPYDQNSGSLFFDPEWMFGITNGFDIVIGNPPYIQLQKDGGALASKYEQSKFKSFAKTGDIYCLFYERACQLLKTHGVGCYITSNKWMRAGYGEKLREFFAKNVNPLVLIDFAGIKVFDSATVDTNIMLFSKGENNGKTKSCVATSLSKDSLANLSDFVRQESCESAFTSSNSWVILSPIEQSIKRKIESIGVPLKNWDVSIYRGVLTGCNDAFIISGEKREEILRNCRSQDELNRTADLIRPILRGKDIKRYSYEYDDLYLIATFPSKYYDIEDYPAVKGYLLSFGKNRLEQTGKQYIIKGEMIKARKKTKNKWFELQDSISYWEEFDKQYIAWSELSDEAKFTYCDGLIVLNTIFFLSGEKLLDILGMLNSRLILFYFKNCLGTTSGVGTNRWLKYTVEQLPLFSRAPREFEDLVKKRISLKSNKIDDTLIDVELDDFVFSFYGLTKEEIKHIRACNA